MRTVPTSRDKNRLFEIPVSRREGGIIICYRIEKTFEMYIDKVRQRPKEKCQAQVGTFFISNVSRFDITTNVDC